MRKLLFLIITFAILQITTGQIDIKQKLQGFVNPEELVSLSETIPFNQALEVLSKVSEKTNGKRIVSNEVILDPIGFEIDNMQYKKALLIIVQSKNLILEERPDVIVVKRKEDTRSALTKDTYVPVDEREVRISALLFEGDVSEMVERGVNWQFLLSKGGLSIGSKLVTLQEQQQTSNQDVVQQQPPEFNLNTASKFTMGSFDGDATAMFRFFETENLGKILARPTVSVINGIKGRTQVGSDYSIKERDFAGNLIDKFFSTGTIIEVTPYIYSEEGIDYVYLNLIVERSSALPDVVSTEIRKTTATTKVLLLNGEETAIGGLFTTEETLVRRGIPILRDLPWWVLGLRYIFGYDQKEFNTKEIIILIKAEILPSLRERVLNSKDELKLKIEREKNKIDIEKYKKQLELDKKEESEKIDTD